MAASEEGRYESRSTRPTRDPGGEGKWIFSLPSEAEWEKVARGPDNFDYALGMSISDNEVGLYNWRKNPGAGVTVVGDRE